MGRKFNGILKELYEQPPDCDLKMFLEDRLQIPPDKAEVLAARIRKEIHQTTETQKVWRMLQKPLESESPSKAAAYCVECLSPKELGVFVQWLLEELGYEVQSKCSVYGGADFVITLRGEKVAVLVRKYPKGAAVTDAILLISQQIQRSHGCNRIVIASTAQFTEEAASEAERLGVELWDPNVLVAKIGEAKEKARKVEQATFPPFQGSLLKSLLKLKDAKLFLVEQKSEGKYDLILPGVRYPLLSFEVESEAVVQCVFRIKYNEPVPENEAEQLIGMDADGNRLDPEEVQAYEAVTKYLSQFLE